MTFWTRSIAALGAIAALAGCAMGQDPALQGAQMASQALAVQTAQGSIPRVQVRVHFRSLQQLAPLEAHGVDTNAALQVLRGGMAGSTVLERKGASMVARDFEPGFRVELHDKDMGIVTSAAREAGVVIPLGAAVAQLLAALRAQGDGGLDHSALYALVSRLSGRDL